MANEKPPPLPIRDPRSQSRPGKVRCALFVAGAVVLASLATSFALQGPSRIQGRNLDGRTQEAFVASLEAIAASLSEADCGELDGALYEVMKEADASGGSAAEKWARVCERLDGMTREDVLREADQIRQSRERDLRRPGHAGADEGFP